MKKSPLQQVNDEFGSKSALAEKLIGLLEKPEDEEQAEFERRIRTASNRQLLRLWNAEQRVKDEFGSRSALADSVTKLKFDGKVEPDYRNKVARYTSTRLLDLFDSLS